MKRKMRKVVASAAALAFALTSCGRPPKKAEHLAPGDYSYTKAFITWLIDKEMKKEEVTGLSIAMVDDQQVVWAQGFGFADSANKVAARPETIYRAGSISKLFTSTATMQLAEQGWLDIDQPIQSYLPEFSIQSRFATGGPITPRTLMTHHSGLPSDLAHGMWTNHPEPFGQVVPMLRDEYVAAPANTVWSYCNLGVTVLGHALERVAGQPYAELLDDSLLSPLGMTHSSFSQTPANSPLMSKGYHAGKEVAEPPLRDLPAGGLNTTVIDLSRFMAMVFANGRAGGRQLIRPETLAEMLRPQNTQVELDLDFRIGLAWFFDESDIGNAGPVVGHGGGTLAHISQLVLLPEHKLGVVVLTNSASAGGLVRKVAAEALKLALEAKAGIKQPDQPTETAGAGGQLPRKALHAYAGDYATDFGVVHITPKSGTLEAKIAGEEGSFQLVPRADGLLGVRRKLFGLVPVSLGELDRVGFSLATVAGHEIVKASRKGRETLAGERIQPVPMPQSWRQRLGAYEVVNGGDDILKVLGARLYQQQGLLLLEGEFCFGPHTPVEKQTLAIAPQSDREAVICGLGRGLGETIRVVEVDGAEELQYSGYILKRKHNNRAGLSP